MPSPKNPKKREKWIKNISASMKGKNTSPKTPEHNAKNSASNKGRWTGDKNPNWKGGKSEYSLGLLTKKEYNKLLEKQNGVCAICEKPETKKLKDTIYRLAIDHDHKTNKVRGLLCSRCNRGLGHFMDNVKFLLKAIKYLNP